LRISVKREAAGVFSNWLHASAREGDRLLISGPFGAMRLPSSHEAPVVLLSAGIGITPTVAMLHELVARPHRGDVVVMHSARNEQHLALWDEARECLSRLPKASGELHLTQQDAKDCAANHAVAGRRVTADDVRALVRPGASYFLCGPLPFLTMARAALAASGVDGANVHADVFISPSLPNTAPRAPASAGPHRVRFARSGKEAVWKPDCGSLLELAEASGVRVHAACRSGVCQSCAIPVRSGLAEHLLAPAMPLTEDIALLCCAAPASDLVLDA
jgi:ferredoxin-NADP reductase